MIDKFNGEYFFLSNFYPSTIILEGKTYRSVEHAFQAMKTLDEHERAEIRKAETPSEAKRLGRKATLRKDWESIKLKVMEDCLRLKFKIDHLKIRLLKTGSEELVEGNNWRDFWWGVCNGKGQNNLGKILMKIREEINGEDNS